MSPLTPESSDVGTPRNRLKEHLDSALAVRPRRHEPHHRAGGRAGVATTGV